MQKSERISAFVQTLESSRGGRYHPCYAGFFECFNKGEYYEAHDVLEHLWLECRDADRSFYQGLIQIAGAFVHLKKQRGRPCHPTDGRRLRPGFRLFLLAEKNLTPFAPIHLGLDVEAVLAMCSEWRGLIEREDFQINPWSPDSGPVLLPEGLFRSGESQDFAG